MRRHAFALVLIVLALGCLNQQGGGADTFTLSPEGLRVVSFELDKNPMRAGEEIGLFLQYQNVGGSDAANIGVASKRAGRLTVTKVSGGETDLFAPDERARVPGGTSQTYFSVKAPDVEFPEAQSVDVELAYDYSTLIMREVPVFTIDRLNELRESTYEAKKGTTQKTMGPISLDLQIEDPIQVDQDCSSQTAFEIILNNVGGGSVKGAAGLNVVDFVEVELQSDWHNNTFNCSGLKKGTIWAPVTVSSISLWKGQNARVSCILDINMTYDPTIKSCNYTEGFPVIVAKANYRYAINKNININVEP
ncbi:MAG: hypothetical protein ABH829_03860 [archaeon]